MWVKFGAKKKGKEDLEIPVLFIVAVVIGVFCVPLQKFNQKWIFYETSWFLVTWLVGAYSIGHKCILVFHTEDIFEILPICSRSLKG